MGFGYKHDFMPLLAPGRHEMSLMEVKARFVDAFPGNKRRKILFQSLEEYIQRLLVSNIPCEVWIDGSFLTEKEDPGDIDVAAILDHDVPETLNDQQRSTFEAAGQAQRWSGLDNFSFVKRGRGDPLFGNPLADPAHDWHEMWGMEHGKRWLKGFVTMRLGETRV